MRCSLWSIVVFVRVFVSGESRGRLFAGSCAHERLSSRKEKLRRVSLRVPENSCASHMRGSREQRQPKRQGKNVQKKCCSHGHPPLSTDTVSSASQLASVQSPFWEQKLVLVKQIISPGLTQHSTITKVRTAARTPSSRATSTASAVHSSPRRRQQPFEPRAGPNAAGHDDCVRDTRKGLPP